MYRALMSTIGRLRSDEHGAVLPIFTVFMLTLLLVTAVGVDYGRALVIKQKLYNAADAAALAVGADPTLTQAEADAKALAFINAHYPGDDFGDLVDYNVDMDAARVDVTVSARIPTTFLKVARIDTIDIAVNSEVLRQQRDIEIVMVLDNTGSMDCEGRNCVSKLDNLKVAANKLVTVLFGDATTSEHVKIGLVPFSGAVNIGTDKLDSGWLDTAGNSFLQVEDIDLADGTTLLDLYDQLTSASWGGCVRARIEAGTDTDLDLTDAAPSGDVDTLWVPYFAPDEPDSGSYSNSYINVGHSSCGGRRQPTCSATVRAYDQRDASHYNGQSGSASGGDKSPNFNCVPQPIQPLTNVKATITTAIEGMQPVGSTVIPAGLSWGWKVISPTAPYTEGVAYSEQRVSKAIILLTDGRNQVEYDAEPNHNNSFYSAYGYAAEGHLGATDGSQTRQTLDNKTTALCNAIKANQDDIEDDQDIYIYTITFDVDDEDTRTLMQSCSTPPADCPGEACYFNSPSAADLETAFESIALGLNKLRLAK
jgi:Flp pilus assembly protein TadG